MKSLPDPLLDRQRKDILPPPNLPLDKKLLYHNKSSTIDI